jgi:transposase
VVLVKPIAAEVRAEVLAACDANEGTRVVAVRFKVSESWVRRVKQRRRETGQVAPQTTPLQVPKWKEWADWLIAKVGARPDIYLRELQAELKAERGEDVCLMTICNACRALELTRKKRR